MKRRYDWLLFDADNTLFDFNRCEEEALRLALQDESVPFHSGHHFAYSRINKQCWRDYELQKITKEELRRRRFLLFFEEFELPGDPAEFGKNYLAHLSGASFLLDGARDLLEALQGFYRLALVTNGLQEVQRPRINSGRLNTYFEVIIVSDEIGHAKPHAPFFDYTFEQIGQPEKNRVLIIGDNFNADIVGGLDFGIHACWFNPEDQQKPQEVHPTYEIRHLRELLPYI